MDSDEQNAKSMGNYSQDGVQDAVRGQMEKKFQGINHKHK